MSTKTLDTTEDVVAFLFRQHEQIAGMFDEVRATHGAQRDEAFTALRRMLAVHETAEEQIVHPRARREFRDGDLVADARLREEEDAKRQLKALEQLDVDSNEFATGLAELAVAVMSHADCEEREEFGRLADELEPVQLERMRIAVQLAERLAPTHPHPGVELAGQHLLSGPFTAMLDRARDLITGKH